MGEKSYILIGGGAQFSPAIVLMDGEAQLEYGYWFMPQLGFAINARGYAMRGALDGRAENFFTTSPYYASLRFMGLLDWTNLAVGGEQGARAAFHIGSYLGGGLVYNFNTAPINSFGEWRNYCRPVISAGMDLSFLVDRRIRLYMRVGLNEYHLSYHDLHPEANLGIRIALGKGREYPKDPNQAYKDDIAALEQELEKERNNIKKDTVVVTETKEVEVEKLVRDTVILKVNQVDTLTIYDVVEVGSYTPEIQIRTVYVDSAAAAVASVDSVAAAPVVQTDTVYVVSEPEVQIQVQTDTVFIATEPEIQIQKDTVYVPVEPEIMVRTVYVNKEPIVVKDTVFVATDPEVEIQTVYRDKEPIILVDTVYVQSEPEIEVRTVYRDREVVKLQKDTVFLQLAPEIQTDTVFVVSESEVQIQKDTVFLQSEPEIQVKTIYVNKEPIVLRDTVFVSADPEVLVQTVYRDKAPIVLTDTVYVQSEPDIEIRYRDREVVKEVVKVDTVLVEKDPIIKIDTVVVNVPGEPEIQIQTKVDTVFVAGDTVIKPDTVFVAGEPVVKIDTVVIEKGEIVKVDTVIVNVPVAIEPESTIIYVMFPENAAWVNYGARKQLDMISEEIKEYDGDAKYLLIAPISPDSEDAVNAYNLGVRRVSQVRLHLIRENGVDSRKLLETVLVSPAGVPVEDGNAFIIVAREDDPRISDILGQ